MLTYGQKKSQDVSYMTSWDETALNWHIISYKLMASMSTADGSKLRGSMNYN